MICNIAIQAQGAYSVSTKLDPLFPQVQQFGERGGGGGGGGHHLDCCLAATWGRGGGGRETHELF